MTNPQAETSEVVVNEDLPTCGWCLTTADMEQAHHEHLDVPVLRCPECNSYVCWGCEGWVLSGDQTKAVDNSSPCFEEGKCGEDQSVSLNDPGSIWDLPWEEVLMQPEDSTERGWSLVVSSIRDTKEEDNEHEPIVTFGDLPSTRQEALRIPGIGGTGADYLYMAREEALELCHGEEVPERYEKPDDTEADVPPSSATDGEEGDGPDPTTAASSPGGKDEDPMRDTENEALRDLEAFGGEESEEEPDTDDLSLMLQYTGLGKIHKMPHHTRSYTFSRNGLARAGVTLDEVRALPDSELTEYNGVTESGLKEIREAIQEYDKVKKIEGFICESCSSAVGFEEAFLTMDGVYLCPSCTRGLLDDEEEPSEDSSKVEEEAPPSDVVEEDDEEDHDEEADGVDTQPLDPSFHVGKWPDFARLVNERLENPMDLRASHSPRSIGRAVLRQLASDDAPGGEIALRASQIGACSRQLSYRLHNVERDGRARDGRARSRFALGDMAEMHLTTCLREALATYDVPWEVEGIRSITEQDKVEMEVEVRGETLVVPGHPDGMLVGPDNLKTVLEVKSLSSYAFTKADKALRNDEDPWDYTERKWWQAQTYIRATGADRCYVLATCLDSGAILGFYVLPAVRFEEMVTDHIRKAKLPPTVAPTEEGGKNLAEQIDDSGRNKGKLPWQCTYCDWWRKCWGDAAEAVTKRDYRGRPSKRLYLRDLID